MSEETTATSTNLIEELESAIASGAEVILIKAPAKKYLNVSLEITKYLCQKAEGIYVTLNRPYASMKKIMQKEGIDLNKLIFIDSITRQTGGEEIDTDRCIYINSPDPTLMQVSIERAMDLIRTENRFIYLDSLSTISLYKSFETLLKFIRYITAKIRVKGFFGALFSVEKELDETYYSQLALMVDEVIEID
ncbi:hypothetical protein Asulf_02160 [Archaeoglobus sulfaticallidus PM70-1]|uniref:KaiC-like domain-containing protein n=1 Tax=Archaeoglobus sulfaticallidus PM70-1 TaxID=387631 RepID=N0BEQ6_9EURY|nr:hypothetical protein [Archaeoglobus sulfaticallidus]AGK62114.1 hypothetical protein Asulf_02160 [Archaeoglobus sulfaticallidus PM70-1]